MFKPVPPPAIKAPAAKSNGSPGKNGVTTKPVSANMIMKKIRYVQNCYLIIISFRCLSIFNSTSMILVKKSTFYYKLQN